MMSMLPPLCEAPASVLDSVLGSSHLPFLSVLETALGGGCQHHHLYLTDEESKAPKGYITSLTHVIITDYWEPIMGPMSF